MPRYTIANMHQWAKKRGGKCLSEKYVNNHTQLEWQCAKGHKWKATPYCIKKSKGWCSECNKIIKREKKLNLLHKIAEKHEGKCLSKAYVNTAMEWKCKNGHKWRAKPITIINGIWCPKCKKKNEKIPWLNQMQKIAKQHGGKCLSKEYFNNKKPLKWKCEKGHTWKATPVRVSYLGIWCPKCNMQKNTVDALIRVQKIAEKHGGTCLSKAYVNTAMEWKCKNGHKWSAKPITILNGKWCPECKKQKEKIPWLNQMQKIAEQHGGKCLSKEYINGESPLKWQCKNGHKWMATPRIVSNFGIWCTKCNKINKTANALKRMQKIAKEHGGKCLSKKYINSHTHLKWQCKDGHIWSTAPRNIVQGNWCPKCYDNRRHKEV